MTSILPRRRSGPEQLPVAIVIKPQRNGVLFAVSTAHPHVVPEIPNAQIQGLQLLESCSFHWIFDTATRRFRRTPRDARVWLGAPEAWTEYHHLEIDAARSCFVVELDEGRTRLLRAWLHIDGCHRCRRDERRAAVASFRGGPVRRAKG